MIAAFSRRELFPFIVVEKNKFPCVLFFAHAHAPKALKFIDFQASIHRDQSPFQSGGCCRNSSHQMCAACVDDLQLANKEKPARFSDTLLPYHPVFVFSNIIKHSTLQIGHHVRLKIASMLLIPSIT
jgi:hypothetical protein